jgi:ADP-ribosylglycohydrolase
MEAVSRRDRIIGALMGLAAGDKNGGPMRMALRLGESLVERNELDMFDVVQRYHKWSVQIPTDNSHLGSEDLPMM